MGIPLVTMHGITKFIYGRDGKALRNTDVKILDDVDFQLDSGEVHVLVGENGAGKSTLMKILGGIIPSDQGQLILGTEQVLLANPREARERGIAFIHQELNLCPNLDISHNIFLGNMLRLVIYRCQGRVLWAQPTPTLIHPPPPHPSGGGTRTTYYTAWRLVRSLSL